MPDLNENKDFSFKPEPLVRLKSRFKAAIADLHNSDERDWDEQGELERKHVFDFEDGYRLVITRCIMGGLEIVRVGGQHFVDGCPVDLQICRVAIHTAELSEGQYSEPLETRVYSAGVYLTYALCPALNATGGS